MSVFFFTERKAYRWFISEAACLPLLQNAKLRRSQSHIWRKSFSHFDYKHTK